MDIQKLIQDEAERSAKGYYGVTTLEYDHLVNETTYGKGYMTGASFALSLDRWVEWDNSDPNKRPEQRQHVLTFNGMHQVVCEYKHGCFWDGLEQVLGITHFHLLPSPPSQ